jgi:hypothetical protein
VSELVAVVIVNWGRWLARCPRPGCTFAEYYGVAPANGALRVGGLQLDRYVCLAGCGGAYAATWPAPSLRAGIEQLLALRPAAHRNWEPPQTLADLLEENAAHGILAPTMLDPDEDGIAFNIVDDVVTVGGSAVYGAGRLTELAAKGE